jgi:hypothetical protein
MIWLDPNLHRYGKKVYSQTNEDGIVAHLLTKLNIATGFFVEFGIAPPFQGTLEQHGLEGNCRLLAEKGWSGLWMDGNSYPPELGVRQEFVSPLNINHLLRSHGVPSEPDIVSIDIDGQDFWVWMNMLSRPKVLVIEYNPNFGPAASKTVPFDPDFHWDGTKYYGATLLALDRLARSRLYTLVYANGVNSFFLRDDLLANQLDFTFERLYVGLDMHVPDPLNRPWTEI